MYSNQRVNNDYRKGQRKYSKQFFYNVIYQNDQTYGTLNFKNQIATSAQTFEQNICTMSFGLNNTMTMRNWLIDVPPINLW